MVWTRNAPTQTFYPQQENYPQPGKEKPPATQREG